MTLSQIYNVPYEKFFILQVAKNETNKREPA
jgi:putative transcriptional regulator